MTIKILVVDDSALMRRQLTQIFQEEGDFEIRMARNGQEALEENLRFQPDVVTLDINMPEMDGLTALAHMMDARPVAVVMVSSLTEQGALATFEALALGAVDYVAKPGGTISLSIEDIKTDLLAKVRSAARARLKISRKKTSAPVAAPRVERKPFVRRGVCAARGLVIIGVSTGGPSTLEGILPNLPADFAFPIIIAQHMPSTFTGAFAQRMNNQCALEVLEVNRPMDVIPGNIYISRGGADVVVTERVGKLVVLIKPESATHLWHPSVELLGRSVLEHCEPRDVIAVMLTGMGHDGADAFAEIKKQGGRTIAEAEETSVVFGMPKELIDRGGATLVLPSGKIATQLQSWTRQ